MAEIKPKKGGNKISKTQKAGTTKKTLFEKENETPSRNASYTPVVGFFFFHYLSAVCTYSSHLSFNGLFLLLFVQGRSEQSPSYPIMEPEQKNSNASNRGMGAT